MSRLENVSVKPIAFVYLAFTSSVSFFLPVLVLVSNSCISEGHIANLFCINIDNGLAQMPRQRRIVSPAFQLLTEASFSPYVSGA